MRIAEGDHQGAAATALPDRARGGAEQVDERYGPRTRDGRVSGGCPVRTQGGDVEATAPSPFVGLGHLVTRPEDPLDGVRRGREDVAVGQRHVAGVAGPGHHATPRDHPVVAHEPPKPLGPVCAPLRVWLDAGDLPRDPIPHLGGQSFELRVLLVPGRILVKEGPGAELVPSEGGEGVSGQGSFHVGSPNGVRVHGWGRLTGPALRGSRQDGRVHADGEVTRGENASNEDTSPQDLGTILSNTPCCIVDPVLAAADLFSNV